MAKEYSTNYPASLDTDTELPTIVNGDLGVPSQINALKEMAKSLEAQVGSDNLENGSLRKRATDLEYNVLERGQELHLYADGTSGSDINDGYSAITPKKTLSAIIGLIPLFIDGTCIVHLAGTYPTSDGFFNAIYKHITPNGELYISGDLSRDAISGTASSYVADIGSTTTVGNSGASFTVNAYAGKWVEILTGAAAGDIRLIYSNTSTTITANYDFSADPSTGVSPTFKIVEPGSKIEGVLQIICNGGGAVITNHLLFQGASGNLRLGGGNITYYTTACVASGAGTIGISNAFGRISEWSVFGGAYDPADLSFDGNNLTYVSTQNLLSVGRVHELDIGGGYCNGVSIYDSGRIGIGSEVGLLSIDGIVIQNCNENVVSSGGFGGLNNVNVEGASGVGIKLINSHVGIGLNGIMVNNSTSHGIELDRSFLDSKHTFSAPITGTGNTGAGLYAHDQSNMRFGFAATTPTITGTVGDVSTDGTTQASTWAAINGGTPVVDANQFTIVRRQ